jgi:4-hydroxythreonine-4-phosphate dehydrogenase
MSHETRKPVIGFSCGDLNGIGIELIIKALSDSRIHELCTPVIFASNRVINYYKKTIPESNFSYTSLRELSRPNPKQVNVFQCWEEEVPMNPGQLTPEGGKYAILSLQSAMDALKEGHLDGIVTAPIHKKNVHSDQFPYTGHTPYLKAYFNLKEVVMLMVASNMRVALLSEHVPLQDAAAQVTKEAILSKLSVLKQSLQKDFGIDKPRIAVLGLNPHAGDDGLIGNEEEEILKPAVKEARQNLGLVFGPYPADAFFAILALYHDQGLIPFKSLAFGEGVNYTAGLPIVRTSPDHGTAFDIAGKNKAEPASFLQSIYTCIDILRFREEYDFNRSNPLRKLSDRVVANAEDEKIEE